MIEDSELKLGGQTFKGAWIAVVLAIGSTIGGGVWTASSLYSRLEAVEAISVPNIAPIEEEIKLIQQQLLDNDISQLSAKLATLGTTLATMAESQKNLLKLQTDVSELSKEIEGMKAVVKQAEIVTESMSDIKKDFDVHSREISDLWQGLDHLSDPLR
jgi:chromosome segregation ATPase